MKYSFNELSHYRTQLMGIAILYVVCFHIISDWAPSWFYRICSKGDSGVDVFIFLSAIGLTYSLNKNVDIIAFYKRRFVRIFPTYWLVITGWYIISWARMYFLNSSAESLNCPDSIWDVFCSYTTIGFWIEDALWFDWYIPAIVCLYLFFPLLFFIMKKTKWVVVLCLLPAIITILTDFPEKWYYKCFFFRIGVFILGAFFYYLLDKTLSKILYFTIIVIGVIALFLYGFTDLLTFNNIIIRQIVFYLLIPCELLALCRLCRIININQIFNYLGVLSIEIYLVHQNIYHITNSISNRLHISKIIQVIIILFTSLLLAQLIHYVINSIMKKIRYNSTK